MDPISIFVLVILVFTAGMNMPAAKKGLLSTVGERKIKPRTYLQTLPPNLLALIFLLEILACFGILTLDPVKFPTLFIWRIAGLVLFLIFSLLQILSFRTLGENYTQEIAILKNHKLVTTGIYSKIRHPQYFAQFIADIGAAIALLSYIILPVAFAALIFLVMRAKEEEDMMERHFGKEYILYKKSSGFFLPF